MEKIGPEQHETSGQRLLGATRDRWNTLVQMFDSGQHAMDGQNGPLGLGRTLLRRTSEPVMFDVFRTMHAIPIGRDELRWRSRSDM